MRPVDLFLALAAMIGHTAISVTAFNRLHALGVTCGTVKKLEKAILLLAAVVLCCFLGYWALFGIDLFEPIQQGRFSPLLLYIIPCWGAAICVIPLWLWRRIAGARTTAFVNDRTQMVDVAKELGEPPIGEGSTRMLAKIPGNQIFHLSVTEKTFVLPRLPESLAGLTIAHLSDLHMTGQLTQAFFDLVVDRTNALDCDVVVLTGDIIEKSACLPWLRPTLGRLQSRYGVYYVLGNHDKRLSDVPALHEELKELGLIHVGGRTLEVQWRDQPLLLAGNEMPWFEPLPQLNGVANSADEPFRLLLSHSPDQFYWARRNNFDLMLAGHTHGGQIRFPFYGPLIAPSRFGVMFASGVFQHGRTLMHVSRGVSGLQPIRLNCPPEISKLTLQNGH